MAMHAFHIYEDHKNALPPEAIAKLKATLDAYGDDLKGLAEAMEGLTRFMIYVGENLKDTASGEKVADLMRSYTPKFEPFWQRVAEAMQNVGAESKGSFQQFLDKERAAEKKAPVFGAAAPKDAVPLRNLAPPARPPPWAKKPPPK